MGLSGSAVIFLTALTAIPLSYTLNLMSQMKDPALILLAGAGALVLISVIPYLHLRSKPHKVDWFYYVLSLFTFSSVIDLIMALENDGVIAHFMEFYLRNGEPYLKTAYGTMIGYWDGIAHFAMYLMILAAQSWNESYRSVGLYWAGSIGGSMLVLIPGIFVGEHGVRWPILLNIPYLVIPFWAGVKFMREPTSKATSEAVAHGQPKGLVEMLIDCFFGLSLAVSAAIAVLRFSAAMGGTVAWAQQYLHSIEPFLEDSSGFPKVQMMVYMFYFVPYYAAAIYGLFAQDSQQWMQDWSLIHAGAAAQAQFSHMGASIHSRTPYIRRVPQNGTARTVFWTVNLFLFILPQLLAFRCCQTPGSQTLKDESINHSAGEGKKIK